MIVRAVVTITNANLGGTGTNTWHVRLAEPPVTSVTEALEDAMEAIRLFYDQIKPTFNTVTEFRWDGLAAGVGPDEGQFLETTGWSVVGILAGGTLPPANCIVVGWTGTSGDRSKRGRTFLGPIGTAVNETNGTIAPTNLTNVRAGATALVAASQGGNGWGIGVWSRQEGVIRDFVASQVRDQFGVLRSRRD